MPSPTSHHCRGKSKSAKSPKSNESQFRQIHQVTVQKDCPDCHLPPVNTAEEKSKSATSLKSNESQFRQNHQVTVQRDCPDCHLPPVITAGEKANQRHHPNQTNHSSDKITKSQCKRIALNLLLELPVGQSLKLQASATKIDEQPHFQVIGLQVVHSLRQVYVLQLSDGLQFH